MKNMTLGDVLGIGARDEMVAFSETKLVTVVRAERSKAEKDALRLGWDHQEAIATEKGLGAKGCPYCACLGKLLASAGETVPTERIITSVDLPMELSVGFALFEGRKGIKTNQDHIRMHSERARYGLYVERAERRKAREARDARAAKRA